MALSATDLAAVRWYVKECTRNVMRNSEGCATNDITVEERIANILRKQPPLTEPMLLWRGHVKSPNTISPNTWFSTSISHKSAKNLFTNNASGCCLFKIHVMPGIRVLNVSGALLSRTSPSGTRKSSNKSPKRSSKSPTRSNKALKEVLDEEKEWIIEGGGVFYKNKEGTQKGFHEHDGIFETYYYPKGTMKSPTKLTVAELVALIDPDEYEFVDEDYFNSIALPTGSTASPTTKKSAAKQIQKMVEN